MPISDLFKLVFRAAIIFSIIVFVGFTVTGKINRAHHVLPEKSSVTVAGQSMDLAAFAQKHQPSFYASSTVSQPNKLYYEVVDTTGIYAIIYHAEWKNEEHPNMALDVLNKTAGLAYYGFNFHDVEFVQIDVDKTTGEIIKVLAPTVFAEEVNTGGRQKLLVTKDLDSYYASILDENGNELSKKNLAFPVQSPLAIDVLNWNHLMVVASGIDGKSKLEFPLVYLDDETYKSEKFARRDHAEYFTPKSPANKPIIFFVASIFLFYFTVVQWSYLKKSRERKNAAKG
ncbi:hypothetical protein R9C00_17960 [Flammeovirgaceae bacterium SG7u.111]|nr:hypothetical protein [Flammeovirgaceae bacterium SG7u.132]WPO33590.1 hypothetical protein R9C00_17960 [Flammeovirgaceae bacterium SG7u.111]